MRRGLRLATWTLGLTVAVPLLLLALVLIGASSDAGRHLIERLTATASSGGVQLTGLSGRFPNEVRLARLQLRDGQGIWLTAEDLQLRWTPGALLERRLQLSLLHAGRVAIDRAPRYAQSPRQSSGSGIDWVQHVALARLELLRLELGAPLAGTAVAVSVQGAAELESLQRASLQLRAQRLDAVAGTYRASALLDSAQVQAQLEIEEGADGPVANLANLPALGPLSVHLRVDGPRTAVRTELRAQAGPLQGAASGTVDLPGRAAALDVSLEAPAMAPRSGLSWQRVTLHGHWSGPVTAPLAAAHLELSGLTAGAMQLSSLQADLHAQRGSLGLDAQLRGLALAGRANDVLEGAPLALRAQVKLEDPARPIDFSLSHPAFDAHGGWHSGRAPGGSLTLSVNKLQFFAALAGLDLSGRGTLEAQLATHGDTRQLALQGALEINGGQQPLAALLAPRLRFNALADIGDRGLTLKRSELEAPKLQATLRGSDTRGALDLNWTAALPDLAVLSSAVAGRLKADGRVSGEAPRLAIEAGVAGAVSVRGSPSGALHLALQARDVPQRLAGEVQLSGALDAAPLQLAGSVERGADGAFDLAIRRGDWKSAHAEGALRLTRDAQAALGHLELRMGQLSDLDRVLGQTLQGGFDARVAMERGAHGSRARVELTAREAGLPAQRLHSLTLRGFIDEPMTAPTLALTLDAQAQVRGIEATLKAQADGPLSGLNVRTMLATGGDAEAPANLSSAATLDLPRRTLRWTALQLQYRQQSLRLLAPALIAFGDGIAVDQLRLGVASAQLQLRGRIAPTLALSMQLQNLTPALLRVWMPQLDAEGRLDAEAQLSGSLTQPLGMVHVNARGLRARSGPARGLPAGDLSAAVQLEPQGAQLEARASAGDSLQLQASGRVPLQRAQRMALQLQGSVNLNLANPVLEASGQRLQGRATLDAQLGGTLEAPQVSGTLQLAHGDLQDYPRGVHVTDISATLSGSGTQLQLKQLTAHAGSGTVSASGAVDIQNPAVPIDLKLSAHQAQPLTSDLLTANVDMELKLGGTLRERLDAAGRIHVNRADINIPKALPPSVAVLEVRRRGERAAPAAASSFTPVNLNLTIDAPSAVFVRGRGLDAEVGGSLHIAGTSQDPAISGGFDLRNGTFNLGGTPLTFTGGRLSFNGTGIHKKIDPTLDFTATSASAGVTSTLSVGGYADSPTISLSSTPELPQDEILARLLFGVSVTQLTPLQIAQIGAALATIGGVGGAGLNPLNAIQRKLGLDRLAVSGGGSASNTSGESSGATIEAGRYVSSRVYVGAKQSTTGTTQALVQVDLSKHLKVQTTLGTGSGSAQGATPQNDPGSSVGLSYQFDY